MYFNHIWITIILKKFKQPNQWTQNRNWHLLLSNKSTSFAKGAIYAAVVKLSFWDENILSLITTCFILFYTKEYGPTEWGSASWTFLHIFGMKVVYFLFTWINCILLPHWWVFQESMLAMLTMLQGLLASFHLNCHILPFWFWLKLSDVKLCFSPLVLCSPWNCVTPINMKQCSTLKLDNSKKANLEHGIAGRLGQL